MTATPVITAGKDQVVSNELFDDIFGSAPASPTLDANALNSPEDSPDVSDVKRLRSTHVTNGYREGIAASKQKHIQEGFDEGFSLGAEIGLATGWILGVLEAVGWALSEKSEAMRERVRGLRAEAEEELQTRCLFNREYFGEDGIWVYDIPDRDPEGEITFKQVAIAHPIVKKWTASVLELAAQLGLKL